MRAGNDTARITSMQHSYILPKQLSTAANIQAHSFLRVLVRA